MGKDNLHNVFGEPVGDRPVLASPQFGRINEKGELVPNFQTGIYTDSDGFDTRNTEENGNYRIEICLAKGTRLCRYGTEYGRYTTYVGAMYEQLALPWDIHSVQYHEYEVVADGLNVALVVTKGIVGPQPGFGSEGGAIQFLHRCSVFPSVHGYVPSAMEAPVLWSSHQHPVLPCLPLLFCKPC